ncbi:MAG TPA: UDP-N-acetylmuramate dehydrogenase [Candidatus Dormibacteraeota bacterium]|nr:UDP-N-acetylmuramate dehydrogenase [Candidatus Dormibacteraeota bacterium]
MNDAWLAGEPGVRRNEPLARHTQYGIGGSADFFLTLHDPERLADLMPRCKQNGVPFTVLGAGSNTLVLDGGIRGLVVRMSDRHLRVIDEATIELSGGYMMPRAALDLARKGIAGMEFGIGIPGTTGASVRGNAGAFGTEIKDVMTECVSIDSDGAHHTIAGADCGFAYRHSRFKDDLLDHVIVAARFRVHRDDPVQVRQRTDAVQAQRKASQPYGIRSLGSVFKNPPGDYAGRLVEAAGLRGRRIGGAQISDKHANFIVNLSHASAADVLALAELAHDAVLEQFGVDLEREIVVLGEPQAVPR